MTYTLEHAFELCGVPASELQEAAHLIGEAEALFSTVLQGVYQSHQATARRLCRSTTSTWCGG
jgi:anaerobic selenocysteine-containing dehydrogenase